MDVHFARSRRRAAARRCEPPQRSKRNWHTVRIVLLALLIFAFVGESTRLKISNARSAASEQGAVGPSVGCKLPVAFYEAFVAASRDTGLPVALIAAMAYEESRFDPYARSQAGAQGLLQLMPGTARELAVSPSSPAENVRGGARYLRQLLRRFDGDLELALAAYNAGPTAVEKAGAAPSMQTLTYVKNVQARAARLAACRA
jgi:soluble lytic murein transglycosylase-like protein